jgi:DNA-binding CsgD family transcriptional regulator
VQDSAAAPETPLHVAPSTARTHLKSIFQKTGTTSQAELVRLLASFAPPLRR